MSSEASVQQSQKVKGEEYIKTLFEQYRRLTMWYFSWILGLGLACSFSILNAMWLELHEDGTEKPR